MAEGQQAKYLPGATVTFRCHPGYTMQGSQDAKCHPDGRWVPAVPSCEPGEHGHGCCWHRGDPGAGHPPAVSIRGVRALPRGAEGHPGIRRGSLGAVLQGWCFLPPSHRPRCGGVLLSSTCSSAGQNLSNPVLSASAALPAAARHCPRHAQRGARGQLHQWHGRELQLPARLLPARGLLHLVHGHGELEPPVPTLRR